MSVERAELLRSASLARLRLTEVEIARLTEQLNAILEHVERLLTIELTAGAESSLAPNASPAGRADVAAADPLLRPLSELAPGWRDGYFTVPRVLAP